MENIGIHRYRATASMIGTLISAGGRVVEIGSNDGSFRGGFPDADWTTVDKYGNPDVRADLDGEGVRLPFEESSVDLVVCTEVLEHLRMGSPLVAEFGRILKPGGWAVISVPNICSLKSRIKVAFGGLPNMAASGDAGHPLGGTGVLVAGHWVAAHVMDFNLQRLRGYLARGGLRIRHLGRMRLELKLGMLKFSLPRRLVPVALGDFLLVAAQPEGK